MADLKESAQRVQDLLFESGYAHRVVELPDIPKPCSD